MPKVIYDPSKGLFQKSGTGFSGTASLHTMSGNAETISTGALVVRVDPGGSSRDDVVLQPGTEIGQICTIINVADAAETIDFDAQATSNLAGADGSQNLTIPQYGAVIVVWSGSLWHLTSQSLA